MNRVMAKNTIASHLVALDRKFDEPREPNTVAEAPPPKPVPACAPEPRCIRISAIIEIATSTNNTLRTNINIGWTLGGGFPAGNRSMDSRSEEHTSELQSLMRISYAAVCLKKKNPKTTHDKNKH